MSERKLLPSVSTALLLAVVIGILEALAMYLGSGLFLSMMGISPVSKVGRFSIRYLCIPSYYFLWLTCIICSLVLISVSPFESKPTVLLISPLYTSISILHMNPFPLAE